MTQPRVLRCYGDGHLAIVSNDQPRIDIDPVLPSKEDARDQAIGALPAAFVLLTHGGTEALDDALDLLEVKPESVLVASAGLCDRASESLDLDDRLVDLADWDRVRFAGARVTGLPPVRGGLPGLGSLPGVESLPDPRSMLSSASDALGRALEALPAVGNLARQGEGLLGGGLLGGGLLGGGLLGGGHRRPLHIAFEGGPSVLFAADNLAGGPADSWLDSLADELDVDLLVAAVAGDRVEGLVHAVRTLAPTRVLLYRDHDPYEGKSRSLPIDRFVAALKEDQPELSVATLRAGDEVVLSG